MQDPIYNQYFDDYEDSMKKLMEDMSTYIVYTANNKHLVWTDSEIVAGITVLNKGEMPLIIEKSNQINK